MKVLVIHNFHRKGSASGDDQVFKSETKLLEENGIDIIKYTVSNDEFDNANIIKKIFMIFGMLWSLKNYRNVKKIIIKERPDIVHVHTFFPLLSPSILYASKKYGCKVVTTLHDTRFICPCATSLCGNTICNKCGDGKYFRICKYKCFKNSKIQSFITACVFKFHRCMKTFYKKIDKYICLNDNQIELLKNIGFDEKKIVKKYNFVEDINIIEEKYEDLPNRYVVFYGRIGEEKGIKVLQKIWDLIEDIPLIVMGAGPLEKEFEEWSKARKNVYFLGYTEHKKCLQIVKNSEFVIFPSIWYEGCSMVEIETECLGKGLVATDLGFSNEAIINGCNGYKIELNNIVEFEKKIRELWNDKDKCIEIGKNARRDFEKKYLPSDNFLQLKKIYDEVVNEKCIKK